MRLAVDRERVRVLFTDLPELETPRVRLRRITQDDIPAIFAYASDPLVSRYMTWSTHSDPAETRAFVDSVIEGYAIGRVQDWGLELKASGRLVGMAGFVGWEPDSDKIGVGYVLNRDYWGMGLMTEVMRRIVGFAFEACAFRKLFATCDARNRASARVLEKIGMIREGLLRQDRYKNGEPIDVLVYGLLRDEYLGEQCATRNGR